MTEYRNFKLPHDQYEVERKSALGPYSFSQLSLFRECPRKYWLRYVSQLPTPPTRALRLGSTVHHAIEKAIKKIIERNPSKVKVSEFIEAAKKDVVDNDIIKDYGTCLNRFANWFPVWWKGVQGRGIVEIVSEYPFGLDRNWNPVDWSGDRDHKPKGMLFRGAIDLLAIFHEEDTAFILDIKSGKNAYEVFSQGGDPARQLSVYASAIHAIHPHITRVVACFFNALNMSEPEAAMVMNVDHMIHHGKKWVIETVTDIESRNMMDMTAWPPKQQQYCYSCDYRTGCPIGKHATRNGSYEESLKLTLQALDEDLLNEF